MEIRIGKKKGSLVEDLVWNTLDRFSLDSIEQEENRLEISILILTLCLNSVEWKDS